MSLLLLQDLDDTPATVRTKQMQGGHGTGKTGNLVLTFSRQGKHREFCSDTGKNLLTQGKYLDCDYLHKKYVYFFKFQKFLASLHSA